MRKLCIFALAWGAVSAGCVSLDDIPLKADARADAAYVVLGVADAGVADAAVTDAIADAALDSVADAADAQGPQQPPDSSTPLVDASLEGDAAKCDERCAAGQFCNAQSECVPTCSNGFCRIARFRPESYLAADDASAFVLEGPSVDALGNRGADARAWKVNSGRTLIAGGFALGQFVETQGVNEGFLSWIDNHSATFRVPTAGGTTQQFAALPSYAVGTLVWSITGPSLELRTSDGATVLASTSIPPAVFTAVGCGDVFYTSEASNQGRHVVMRNKSNLAAPIELAATDMFNRLLCDSQHLYVPHVQLSMEGWAERIDVATKRSTTIAKGFAYALRAPWIYSLRQFNTTTFEFTPGPGSFSVERWSTETPGNSQVLGVLDNLKNIAATSDAVYVLDAQGNLFRSAVAP